MKLSLCQMIAIASIFAIGITLVIPIQETEADRYATRSWERYIRITHNNGDETRHVTESDTTYSIDHSTRTTHLEAIGRHYHDSPDTSATFEGFYLCYLNSMCSLCD